jgi:hypothetical protein
LPTKIEVLPDDATEPGVQGTKVETKPFLLAAASLTAPNGQTLYCSTPPATFKKDLIERLAR